MQLKALNLERGGGSSGETQVSNNFLDQALSRMVEALAETQVSCNYLKEVLSGTVEALTEIRVPSNNLN